MALNCAYQANILRKREVSVETTYLKRRKRIEKQLKHIFKCKSEHQPSLNIRTVC